MGFGRDFFGAATAALPQGVQLGIYGIENARKRKEDAREEKIFQMKLDDDKVNIFTKAIAKETNPTMVNKLIAEFRWNQKLSPRVEAMTKNIIMFNKAQLTQLDEYNDIIKEVSLGKKGSTKTKEDGELAHMGRKALYRANNIEPPLEYIWWDRFFGLDDKTMVAMNVAEDARKFKADTIQAGRVQANLAFTNLNSFLKLYADAVKSDKQKKPSISKKPPISFPQVGKAIFQYRDGIRKSEQSSEIADRAIRGAFDKFGVDIGEFPSSGLASYGTLAKTAEANRQKETADQKALRLQRNDTAERQKQAYEFKKTKYKMGYLSLIPQVEENLSKVLKGYPILQGKTPEELLKVEAGHGESKPWFWVNTPGLSVANARLIHNLVKEIMGYKQAIKEIDDARNIGKGNINFNALTTTTK